MALEIERKFRVNEAAWRRLASLLVGVRYVQGYLNRDPERTVRVRIAGEQAFLTIKGRTHQATRLEFEYPIPLEEAQALLALCDGPLIDKTRYRLLHAGMTWEVDDFHGDNAGLIVAEIELASEDQPFESPSWLAEEVTHDARYFNSALAVQPYRTW
jgi:CYTH domain-containing protein